MKRNVRKNLLLLSGALLFAALASLPCVNTNTAKAELKPAQGTFEMVYGGSVKLSKDGLRFCVKMDEGYYRYITSENVDLYAYISPAEKFNEIQDGNYKDLAVKVGGKLDEAKIYKDGSEYYANICITNLYSNSTEAKILYAADMSSIAFIVDATTASETITYAQFAEKDGVRSADNTTRTQYEVVNAAMLDGTKSYEDNLFTVYGDWYGNDAYPIAANTLAQYESLAAKLNASPDKFTGKSIVVDDTVNVSASSVALPSAFENVVKTLHTITFKDYDGRVLETVKVRHGETFTAPTPTREADKAYTYEFDGWGENYTNVASASAVYTAQYSSVKNKYTVVWKNADGSVLDTAENVEYGTIPEYCGPEVVDFSTATTAYTSFKGWDSPASAVEGNTVYTAAFENTTAIGANMSKTNGVYKVENAAWITEEKTAAVAYSYSSYSTYSNAAVYSVKIKVSDAAGNPCALLKSGDPPLAGIAINRKDGNLAVVGLNNYGVVGKTSTTTSSPAAGKDLGMARRYDLGDTKRWSFEESPNAAYALDGSVAERTLSVVIYNDTLYIYVDGELIKNLALTDTNYLNCFTAGGDYRFGLLANGIDKASGVTMRIVTEKYGADAAAEIKSNPWYNYTINGVVLKNNMTVSGNTYTTTAQGWASSSYSYNKINYGTSAVYSVKITSEAAFSSISGSEGIVGICFTAGTVMPKDKIYRDNEANTLYSCMLGFRSTSYTSLVVGRSLLPQSAVGGRDVLGGGSCPLLNAGGSALLTVVYHNDTLYMYVDGVYRHSVGIDDSRLTARGSISGNAYGFRKGDALMFGVNSFNSSTKFTFEVQTELYGEEAVAYIAGNYTDIPATAA